MFTIGGVHICEVFMTRGLESELNSHWGVFTSQKSFLDV